MTAPAPLGRSAIGGLERRLLFGSDTPNVGIRVEDLIARVRSLALEPADEAAILGGTADRLLARDV